MAQIETANLLNPAPIESRILDATSDVVRVSDAPLRTAGRAAFRGFLLRLMQSIELSVHYSTPKFSAVGALAVLGFPLYYWIWKYVFPQPYENLWLRLFGSALFIPLMLVRCWPRNLRRFIAIYWYCAIFFGFPFFFNFMLFKNHGSQAWIMSTLVALFLMILLLDWVNLILMFITGTALAWIAFWLTGEGMEIPLFYVGQLPIFAFAVVAGAVFNFNREMVAQEKLGTMLTAASNIAHELRTPLLGIKGGASGIKRYFPALLEAYRLARAHDLPVANIRGAHFDGMLSALDRMQGEVDRSNTIIDMLLFNAKQNRSQQGESDLCSMKGCVDSALDRYPFASAQERQLVSWDNSMDFQFFGSETLMVHVFFNLLKNSLHAIARARRGTITIWVVLGETQNQVNFRDTGPGIPPTVLPRIFKRFYTWSQSSEGEPGTGVGLAFCKSVVEGFGGTLVCRSTLGEFTEFTMSFPKKGNP